MHMHACLCVGKSEACVRFFYCFFFFVMVRGKEEEARLVLGRLRLATAAKTDDEASLL